MATLIDKLIAKRNDFVAYVADAAGHYLIKRKRDCIDYVSAGLSATVTDIPVTQQQSGATFMVNSTGANSTISLPAHQDGLHYRFLCVGDSGAHTITIAGDFVGNILLVSSTASMVGGSQLQIAASDFKIGDHLELVSYGSKWHVTGALKTTSAIAAS